MIPVGPSQANKQWLDECINSAIAANADEILLMDDGAQLEKWNRDKLIVHEMRLSRTDNWFPASYQTELVLWNTLSVYKLPWRTGISHAFNYGVALARNECVFLLGSDDTLEPNCLERCWEAYEKTGRKDGYYSVPVRYMSTGELQTIPCNAAMVTKGFWKMTGGFPIETAIGRGDNALLSICMNRPELPVYWVGHITGHDDEPLYNYREHPGQWTPYASSYAEELISIINKLTANWQPPDWTEKY